MPTIRYRVASWILGHRKLSSGVVLALTVFFALGIPHVQFKTIFSDLLPKGHPFAETYRAHPNFGNPLTITVMIKRTDGDIYNTETLQKVWQFTRDIDLAPGVDHDQILSIATEKARYAEATPTGIDMRPLMEDHVPQDAEEVAVFKRRLENSPGVRTFLVSEDGTATLINATFIEQRLDYGTAFTYIQDLVKKASDEHHKVYLAGQPAMTGWIYKFQQDTRYIYLITLGALMLSLALYMRNVVGTVMPIIAATVSAIWGFGFIGWLRQPIEPLLMLVPLLLVARAFSHCVQITERFFEVKSHVGDKVKAAEITMKIMMAPGILGIFTDVAAISLIAVAPIPAMERFALFAGFWAAMLVPTTVFFAPLLLAWLPDPKNVEEVIGHGSRGGVHKVMKSALVGLSRLSYGKAAIPTGIVTLIIGVVSLVLTLQIKIGNPVEGTNLLENDSEFNVAVSQINRNFPGVNTLEIVLEAKDQTDPSRVARQADTIDTMLRLQRLIESSPNPPKATLSFADYLMDGNRLFAGGNPKWMPLDPNDRDTNAAASVVMIGSSPKAFSNVVNFEQQNSTVSLWYKDNKQETVDLALATARKAVEEVGVDHKAFKIRLATGTIALQQALNDTVHEYHWIVIGLLNLVILIGCSYAYKSWIAGLLLLIPVNMSNFVINACMSLMGIGLDINSLLVAAIGVGVGIDYGIYLLSRICEEYENQGRDLGKTIAEATTTTGQAIMFTATIMLIGILPWYFLTPLKFMADMGLLLSLTMVINMIMSLVVLPLLVWFVRPSFVGRKDLLITETYDKDEPASGAAAGEYKIMDPA